MSEEKHLFQMTGTWVGSSDGDGELHCAAGVVPFGVPAQLGGASGRANPEEMLLGAVAACYVITLSILAERRRLPISKVEISADGEVVRQPGGTLKFTQIWLKPVIHLDSNDEAHLRQTHDSAVKAETYCLISNALHGNVTIHLEPTVVTP
jgi:peroxiredoxin-like protein